ncbi:MAG: hypothetical protein L6Q99_07145 [Planctomycetes bacterium]|nr:hypothetical protein [Planctomycetota bacterium]
MRLVRTLGWLYGAFALLFGFVGVVAVVDGRTVEGLPWWVFLVLGACNAAFAVAVLRRARAVVPVLRFVHTTLAVLACLAAVFAWLGSNDADPWRAGAKCLVHAALAIFWWRSHAVAEWFGRSARENAGRS